MYQLENNVEWTAGLRNAFKHGITRAKIIHEGTIITEDTGIVDVKIEDNRYVPDMGFIGQATAKRATITLKDTSGNWNFENQEFQLLVGADYENSTYYINYGNFIVNESPETDVTAGTIKLIAFDYMLRFNKDYVDNITYPCTMKQLLENICTQANVELGTTSFANDDFVVEDNQFEGKTLREVLQNIAKSAFSWARIGQDNKLYLDLEVKDSGKIHLDTIKGDTSQSGTPTPSSPIDVDVVTGGNKVVVSNKNLFDSNNSLNTGTNAGITITKNNDGTYDYEGTATTEAINIWLLGAYSSYSNFTDWDSFDKSKIILKLGAGTYTFTDIRAYFVFKDDSKLSTGNAQINTSTTITFTQTAYCVAIGTPHPPEQGVYFSGKLYPQLEKSSTATDYIQHQEQSYEVNLGKNLFKPFSYTRTNNGITFNYNTDGTITANGTATSNALSLQAATALSNGYYVTLEAGTYTLSGGTGNSNIRLSAYTTGGTSLVTISSATSGRFTLTEKTNVFLRVYITTGTTADNIEIKPQLEKGSLTPYASYFEPIELCKIGTYQDKIYRQNGTWYLHKEVEKIIYNGASGENWNKGSNTYQFYIAKPSDMVAKSVLLCNYFANQETASNNGIWASNSLINLNYLNYTTTNDLKTWLSSNNVSLYYVLSTPTDTEITNQALISQLEELYNLRLYEDSNYFTLISQDLDPIYEFIISNDILEISNDMQIYRDDIDNDVVSETITIDEYEKDGFKKANEYFGRINTIVYGQSNISGQEESVQDNEDVEINGIKQLVINDNYFAYTSEKRSALVQAGTRLFGLRYMPVQELKTIGFAYLDCTDIVKVEDLEGNNYYTMPLNHTIKYNGVLYDSFSSENSSINEQIYENKNTNTNSASQTEIIVDRALKTIQSISKDVYEEDGVIQEQFTQVYQDVRNIINTVQNAGGANLIKNSVMFALDTDGEPTEWETTGTGTIETDTSAEALSNGGISGHIFTLHDLTIKQTIAVTADSETITDKTYYSFACRVLKGLTGTGYVKIYNDVEEYQINIENNRSYYYEQIELTGLLPKSNYYIIEVYGSSEGVTFTDLMLNIGEYKTQWQQASGEIMNTQVNINIDGVLVKSSVYEGDYTVMSPLEFAGYSKINGVMTKVFSLNKDTTEMEKIKVVNGIEMPPIKVIPILTGNKQGWAFVPLTE